MSKVLYRSELRKESKDLDAEINGILDAFYSNYRGSQEPVSEFWVHKVLEDAVIVQSDEGLQRWDFTKGADGFTFADPVAVEVTYAPVAKSAKVKFLKADDEKRLVYGVVMEPDATDSEGDQTNAVEIERACHGFMLEYQDLDLQHERAIGEEEAAIVESYIAPSDLTIGDTTVGKGCWIMVTKIFSEEVWKSVKTGEITGYSIVGWGSRHSPGGG